MGKWALKIATVRPVQLILVAPSRLKKASWPERSAGLACKESVPLRGGKLFKFEKWGKIIQWQHNKANQNCF